MNHSSRVSTSRSTSVNSRKSPRNVCGPPSRVAQITELAKRGINGRQIKNAARTAHCLALGMGKQIEYEYLRLTLDVMDEFTRERDRRDE